MRKLLIAPDPLLMKPSEKITEITPAVKALAREMMEFVKAKPAYGLAAVQLGEPLRLIVVNCEGYSLTMINPELVTMRGKRWLSETCLSLPGKVYLVPRPKLVKVRGLNLEGKVIAARVHDLIAQAVMHELNHLDGVLINQMTLAKEDLPSE